LIISGQIILFNLFCQLPAAAIFEVDQQKQ
jgi:hypothetical protein